MKKDRTKSRYKISELRASYLGSHLRKRFHPLFELLFDLWKLGVLSQLLFGQLQFFLNGRNFLLVQLKAEHYIRNETHNVLHFVANRTKPVIYSGFLCYVVRESLKKSFLNTL